MGSEYTHVVINLFLVLSLMLGLAYLAKKFKFKHLTKNQYIKVIQAVSIGSREKIILMEVNNTILLLGATPHQIETLYVFDSLKENVNQKGLGHEVMAKMQ